MSESNTRAETVEVLARRYVARLNIAWDGLTAHSQDRARETADDLLTALEASGRAVVPRDLLHALVGAAAMRGIAQQHAVDRIIQKTRECLAAALPPSKE